MNAYFKGQPIFGPRGPAGPDGNPVGTVISFLGQTAPKDYLACDGAEYSIGDYPALAAFFQEQFGSANHFGGDGETTFAVPDMRNLFLRGYHGEAEERLSGVVGARQEATEIPNIYSLMASSGTLEWAKNDRNSNNFVKKPDIKIRPASRTDYIEPTADYTISGDYKELVGFEAYTARPVNMAVLYCIKAAESVPAENVYSTEETRVGTWIDKKPVYRRCFSFITPPDVSSMTEIAWHSTGVAMPDVETLVSSRILMSSSNGYRSAGQSTNDLAIHDGELLCSIRGYQTLCSRPAIAVVEYTKTTD